MLQFILTFDVERHSFHSNYLDHRIISRVAEEAIPNLLNLLDELHVRATFFVTGYFAYKAPQVLQLVSEFGHEIGCHGYDHKDFYDILPYNKQIYYLKKAKYNIETAFNHSITSFRAPCLRIGANTVKALEETGFTRDSSISPQRFDGPFTTGSMKKLKWLCAPRQPYYLSHNSPFKIGDSGIIEVPISALLWPFIGTHLRLSPFITNQIYRLLKIECRIYRNPILFLFHPVEILNFKKGKTYKRSNLIMDKLKHTLKMRHLGQEAFCLFKSLLVDANQYFSFITVSEVKNAKRSN